MFPGYKRYIFVAFIVDFMVKSQEFDQIQNNIFDGLLFIDNLS